MSVSRLNYTGRKRIPHDRVNVGIVGEGRTSVVVAQFILEGLGFPETARVVLEAQAGWTVQRFEFGTVGFVKDPADRRLSEFDSLVGLMFRLKVIGTGDHEGRLLGVADRLRPNGDLDQAARKAFVVVRPQDIGDRVWKIEFDESQPILLVNTRLADHQDFLKRREVAALVLPEALQRILEHAARLGNAEDDGDSWQSTAISLGERLAGRTAPPADDEEEIDRWVDEAVGAFARRHQFIASFTMDLAGQS